MTDPTPVEEFIGLLQVYVDQEIKTDDFVDRYLKLFDLHQTKDPDHKTQPVIQAYLDKRISREEFEKEFRRLLPDMMDPTLFRILEDLYEDIDAYSPDWTSEDFERAPYLLDEPGLYREAADALEKLYEYKADHAR